MIWLPPLVSCDGNWVEIVDRIYPIFKTDFVDSRPTVAGWELRLRTAPLIEGKERDFWHLITKGGDIEQTRLPDLERCARIRWARAVLDHACDTGMKRWEQKRSGDTNVAVAIPDFSYIVFLGRRFPERRPPYLVPLTAYFVESERRREKYRREHEEYCQQYRAQNPP